MAFFIGNATNTFLAPNFDGLFDRIRFKLMADTTQASVVSGATGGTVLSPDGNNGIMTVGQTWDEVHYSEPGVGTETRRSILHSTGSSGQDVIYLYMATRNSTNDIIFMTSSFRDPSQGIDFPNTNTTAAGISVLRYPNGNVTSVPAMTPGDGTSLPGVNAPMDYWLVADQDRIIIANSFLNGVTLNNWTVYAGLYTRYSAIEDNPNPNITWRQNFNTPLFPFWTGPDNVRHTTDTGASIRMRYQAFTLPSGNPDGTYTLLPYIIDRYRNDLVFSGDGQLSSWFLGEFTGYFNVSKENQDTGGNIVSGDLITVGLDQHVVLQIGTDPNTLAAVKLL